MALVGGRGRVICFSPHPFQFLCITTSPSMQVSLLIVPLIHSLIYSFRKEMSNSTYNVSSSHGARYQGQLYIKIGLISTLIKQTKETAVN